MGLDLDICPGAPEFLVTPVVARSRCSRRTDGDDDVDDGVSRF